MDDYEYLITFPTKNLRSPMWSLNGKDNTPVRDAMECLEYGKDNYWTGDKMVDYHENRSSDLPVCISWLPRFMGFRNATNHNSCASDALVASRVNLNPGVVGRQCVRVRTILLVESIVWYFHQTTLILVPKGAEVILRERGLWPMGGRRADARSSALHVQQHLAV